MWEFFVRAQAGKHPSSVSPVSKSFRLKYFSKNSIFWTISFSCLWNISYWAALGFSTTLPAQAHHYKPASLFHQTWPENRRRPFTFDSRFLLCLNTFKDFGMDSLHWWNTFVVVLFVALSITACATVIICSQIKNLDFLFPYWRQLMLGEGDHSTNQEVASLKTEPSPSRQSHGFLEGNGNNLKFT